MQKRTFDVVIAGAGVFGAWTALHLARRGARVLLADMHGPANSRASSGGETRIIRMGYGAEELYTCWAQASLVQWKALFAETGHPLFVETGVLWLAGANDARLLATRDILLRCEIPFETLNHAELAARYGQFCFDGVTRGLFEPHSGVLLARRAVAATVAAAGSRGAEYRELRIRGVHPLAQKAEYAETQDGGRISAGQFVFACGAWLGQVFPEVLGSRIFPTRQEVFFFGAPAGSREFSAPAMPTWLFQDDEMYGMPDIEGRGVKVAFDHHGQPVDPETQTRAASAAGMQQAKEYMARRFPALRDAPLVESRVCQYENTSSGDFLVDHHPEMTNVWFAGGGSGHGFKHGPALGEYLAARLAGEGRAEPRFSLSSKETVRRRAIY